MKSVLAMPVLNNFNTDKGIMSMTQAYFLTYFQYAGFLIYRG